MRPEKEKMLAGELYVATDPELVQERICARSLTRRYNATLETDDAGRMVILQELFSRPWLRWSRSFAGIIRNTPPGCFAVSR